MKNKEIKITYREEDIHFLVPEENYCYYIEPKKVNQKEDDEFYIKKAFYNPIGALPLNKTLHSGMKVLLIVDDLTRPTPKKRLIPLFIKELTKLGIKKQDITILIALGTHRYMTHDEIIDTFGAETVESVRIFNHEWADPEQLIDLGRTSNNIKIVVNKKITEADFSIGIGSIVPHSEAGWSGGGKIVQPGICGWETTAATHLMAAKDSQYLDIAGTINNIVRAEIEFIANKAGLNYIVNFILGTNKQIYEVVGGDLVIAHRYGIKFAKEVYEVPIKKLADVVIVNAYPADLDYWQGDKPVTYSLRGTNQGGTLILVGRFPEGISFSHPILEKYGNLTYDELMELSLNNKINDEVGLAALFIHAHHKRKVSIICVSPGLTITQKEKFGFIHAESVQEAINIALDIQGDKCKIGVIDYGGDLLPVHL